MRTDDRTYYTDCLGRPTRKFIKLIILIEKMKLTKHSYSWGGGDLSAMNHPDQKSFTLLLNLLDLRSYHKFTTQSICGDIENEASINFFFLWSAVCNLLICLHENMLNDQQQLSMNGL